MQAGADTRIPVEVGDGVMVSKGILGYSARVCGCEPSRSEGGSHECVAEELIAGGRGALNRDKRSELHRIQRFRIVPPAARYNTSDPPRMRDLFERVRLE